MMEMFIIGFVDIVAVVAVAATAAVVLLLLPLVLLFLVVVLFKDFVLVVSVWSRYILLRLKSFTAW